MYNFTSTSSNTTSSSHRWQPFYSWAIKKWCYILPCFPSSYFGNNYLVKIFGTPTTTFFIYDGIIALCQLDRNYQVLLKIIIVFYNSQFVKFTYITSLHSSILDFVLWSSSAAPPPQNHKSFLKLHLEQTNKPQRFLKSEWKFLFLLHFQLLGFE